MGAAPTEDDELGVAPRAVRRKTKARRRPDDTVLNFLQPSYSIVRFNGGLVSHCPRFTV